MLEPHIIQALACILQEVFFCLFVFLQIVCLFYMEYRRNRQHVALIFSWQGLSGCLLLFWETQGPPLTTCLGCMGWIILIFSYLNVAVFTAVDIFLFWEMINHSLITLLLKWSHLISELFCLPLLSNTTFLFVYLFDIIFQRLVPEESFITSTLSYPSVS